MRDCTNCVYAKWMTKKVYCMFFSSMTCPKGEGDLHFEQRVVRERAELIPPPPPEPERPAFPKPVGNGVLAKNHYMVYSMRYDEGKLLKEIAAKFGVQYSAISKYMTLCDKEDLKKGNKEWSDWKQEQEEIAKANIKGLTPAGNIPPAPLSPRAFARYGNHPLRMNHDTIFTMLREGYEKKEIAFQLGLNVHSLYQYIQRCEDNWSKQ